MAHTTKTIAGKLMGQNKAWKKHDKRSAEAAHELAKRGKKQPSFFSDTGESHGKGHRIPDNERNRKRWKKEKKATGGRAGFQHGGRTNLLEELGRVEGEHSNKNRRDEVARIHGELNKGYAKGGRAAFKLGSKPRDKQTPSIGRSKGPKDRKPGTKFKRLPVGAEGIFGLGVKGKPHSSPEGRKATSKLAIQRLKGRGKTPGDNLRDKLKDLNKGRLVPDPKYKPQPRKPIDPRSPYIKDRVMTPLRAKKAVGGRIGLKGGSSAQSHYLQHGYGPTKTRLRSGKPKIAIKGWS